MNENLGLERPELFYLSYGQVQPTKDYIETTSFYSNFIFYDSQFFIFPLLPPPLLNASTRTQTQTHRETTSFCSNSHLRSDSGEFTGLTWNSIDQDYGGFLNFPPNLDSLLMFAHWSTGLGNGESVGANSRVWIFFAFRFGSYDCDFEGLFSLLFLGSTEYVEWFMPFLGSWDWRLGEIVNSLKFMEFCLRHLET